MTTHLTLVHAMSPLHAGTGHSVGAIDLPIARERPTGIPLIPGSSLKGALRARSADPVDPRRVRPGHGPLLRSLGLGPVLGYPSPPPARAQRPRHVRLGYLTLPDP